MSQVLFKTRSTESGLYPIRTVSELTGVNAITLRAWERRYGLFETLRKPGGHRLYTQENIDLITRVVGLLDRGMRIGQVKAQLKGEITSSGEAPKANDMWDRYLGRMIASIIQFNEQGLESTYAEAVSMFRAETVTEKLLMPLLKELGRRWEEDEGSIAEEHFFVFYLRNKLGARFHHRPQTLGGPKLLLACLPGDRHETGLLMFALAASDAGYCTILLGPDMPFDELPATVAKTGCEAIILSGMVMPASRTLNQKLPRLAERANVPVFLGGRASVITHDALKRANVQSLGTDLVVGLQRIRALIPLVKRTASNAASS